MILKKLIVGALGTNCYIFGSSNTKEVVIIDPGGEPNTIITAVEDFKAKPIAVLLTHGHFDHTMNVGKILRKYTVPLMFSKKEYDSKVYSRKEAGRWLKEGDIIKIGDKTLHVLETPGHSPGSLSFYSKDSGEIEGEKIEGIVFTGDLLFRRSIGRSDVPGGDQQQLFSSIKTKIMYNPDLTDNFKVFPGHMGNTSIGEEKELNMFKRYFL
jgi:glyoxylase-like metal-dependent hydrolase (beta-lactamase superfamily II)